MPDRRHFLKSAAALGAASMASELSSAATTDTAATAASPQLNATRDPDAPLKLLILGGTGFIGPHQVRHALDRGHSVTLFNRGRTNPGLFKNVETLIGDRDGDLDALRGRRFDAVIDNSGYLPRLVRDSAELLADAVDRYLFISTISVYDHNGLEAGQNEHDAPKLGMEDPTDESRNGSLYGPRKYLCEQAVQQFFGDERTTIVRPGLIAGPGDPTDRIRHWIARIHRGGEILVPGLPGDASQLIDARDLATWSIGLLESGTSGTYNAIGPTGRLSMAEMVHGFKAVTRSTAQFTWVDQDWLAERDVPMMSYMPWIPNGHAVWAFNHLDHSASTRTGLVHRPLADIARAMTDEYVARLEAGAPDGYGKRGGLPWERETELLAAWRARA